MSSLDTFGWDVVYATTFAAINQNLQSSGRLPSTFKAANQKSNTSTSGQWKSWTLVSGSKSNFLNLLCTVASGTADLGNGPVDLAGASWTVQFGLVSQGNGTFVPANSGEGRPFVIGHATPTVTGPDIYKLLELFDAIFSEQIPALGSAFAQVQLNDPSLAPDQPWLAPTSAVFASATYDENDARGGLFALLAMTEGRAANGQVAVDKRLLDGAPAGSEAAVAIGPSLVVRQLLAPAMVGLVQGSSAGDFANDKSGTVIYNSQKLTWGSFEYQADDGSKTIQPTIPRGNIELALDSDEVHLSMSNINFHYPGWSGPGYITVSFDTEQFMTFDFIVRDDGGIVMVPQTGKYNSFNVTIIPSESLQIAQIALNVALQVIFSILGGIVDSVAGPAENAASEALEEGAGGKFTAELSSEELSSIASQATDEEIQAAEAEAGENAGNAIANEANPGYLQKFKSAVMANKWKILLKVVEKAVELPAGQITTIAVWAAKKEYGKLPTLNTFAQNGFKPVSWGQNTSFTPKGATLAGALVFWGETSK